MDGNTAAFWWNVGANLVGSAFGVFLALLIDHRREAGRRERERLKAAEQRDEEEAAQLRIVQWAVAENVELARQALDYLGKEQVFFFTMNTHLLDGATVKLATLSTDQELLWHIEHLRYQLHHLNAKLTSYVANRTDPGVRTEVAVDKSKLLARSIRDQLAQQILPAAEKLLTPLATGMQKLTRRQIAPVRPKLALPDAL